MRVDALTARVWRHGIAFLIAFDAVQLVIRTRMRASLAIAPLPVPAVYRELALSTPGLVTVALVGVGAAWMFARGRGPVIAGVVALAVNRVLLSAFAALDGIYDETSYHAASAMVGWLAGLLFARAIGVGYEVRATGGLGSSRADGQRVSESGRGEGKSVFAGEAETLAGLGAAAMFGATYLNAGTSKLHESGISWADGDTIRLLVLAHQPAGVTSWLDPARAFAGRNAAAAMILSVGTLVIQCGAFLFPWTRRTRLAWGALFVAFHVGIHLVAGSIFFLQAVFLAALFAIPWERLARRGARAEAVAAGAGGSPGSREVESPEAPPGKGWSRRVLFVGAAIVVGLWAIALAPIPPRRHPIELLPGRAPVAAAAVPVSVPVVEALGPLRTGVDLGEGWILRRITIEPTRVVLALGRGAEEVVLDVTAAADGPRGRFDVGSLHISYRTTSSPADAFAGAGESVGRKLTEAAGGKDVAAAFEGWVAEQRKER